ncbi:MAG: tRNA (adenosine(37)-N6)-threonylcarbamoyltransferase complex ATPase subunit type 1 TsaE [Bacillota bacterium]
MLILKSAGSAETREMGRCLGEIVPGGTVITLDGELGVGKTVFAQGVGLGLGVREPVTSPSFVLMNVYEGRLVFYHFDFYRLDEEDELACLGLEEYFYGEGVVLVEWAGKFARALPPARLEITIARNGEGGEETRLLYVSLKGDVDRALLKEWSRQCCF